MIDVAPLTRPAWADEAQQLPTLLRDMGLEGADRDEEVKGAFLAAIDELGGEDGSLGRTLIPTVVRTPIDWRWPTLSLRLPPLIEVVGVEDRSSGSWAVVDGAEWEVDGDRFHWRGTTGWGRDARIVAHHGYLDEGDSKATPRTTVPARLPAALRLMTRQIVDGRTDARALSIRTLLSGLKVYR